MRRSMLALAALTLVALTRPIAAGDKRTSALAVRVTVVRSCSVNTDGSVLPAGMVSCGSRFGPPVMSASSTITMPTSALPAARIDAAAIAPVSSIQAVEASARSAETTAVDASSVERISAGDAGPPSAPAGPREASSAGGGSARADTVSFRVVTVNF